MSLESKEPVQCELFDPSDKIPDFEIDDITRKALCFREDLIFSLREKSDSDTRPLGGYAVSIESIGPQGTEFMIHVISSLRVKDSYAGTKVISSATAKLHCLDEKRREYIHREDGLHEKTLFVGLEEELYHIEGDDFCPCGKSRWQKDLPLCFNGEFISEGANVLLMRYLALKNFHGSLSFQSVMIGGELTTCNYRCTEARETEFNGHTIEVYTVERRMHEECGLVHNSKTQMTRGGNILRHDWLEIPYSLEINSILDPNNLDYKKPKISPPLRSRWSSDAQLMSLYLDKKTCKMAQQSEYLADHPEIKQLISDYAQTLLAVKPMNVLPFTIQHFAAFAKFPDPSELRTLAKTELDEPKRFCSICGISFDCTTSEQPPLNPEGDHEAPGLRTPPPGPVSSEYSLCSVFTKCPSDASCVRKLSGDCSFSPECDKICEGCAKAPRKPCDIRKDCPECPGCIRKLSRTCSFSPECEKSCEGCSKAPRKPCDIQKDCPECPGCIRKLSGVISPIGETCYEICRGCRIGGKVQSSCSFAPDCEKMCEGCAKATRKPCDIQKDCPECPGCRKTCSEMDIRKNHDIEILP